MIWTRKIPAWPTEVYASKDLIYQVNSFDLDIQNTAA